MTENSEFENISVVLKNIYDLYNNPDASQKERASKWLADFQKSLFSWKISDQLLQQKNDLHSCYFAAQTLRSKIQTSFHELPESAHFSLRDSLMEHISHIDSETNPIIVTQLCLAMANLTLIMAEWQNPIESLLEKFSPNPESMQPLIIILTFIPEEVNSRHLRLGENRRNQIQKELENFSPSILNYLQECLLKSEKSQTLQNDIIKCCTSWINMNSVKVGDLLTNAIFAYAYQLLALPTSTTHQMDIACDCICAVLQTLSHNNNEQQDDVENKIFFAMMQLEESYNQTVAMEDIDKSMNLCRVFTVMAETFLPKMVNNSTHTQPHFSLKCLDMLLNCVGHYDFEVAQITFNVWYKLSEELYHKNDTVLTKYFKPYVERLIEALYKHSQMDADHEGLLEDGESFQEFRFKVSELIKDVVFIVSSISCFKHMFLILTTPNVTWESTEAALFIMECVARNILPEENEIVPKVVEAILNLPENCHIAIKYTSINILGELCDWIDYHPETLEAILNFLLMALKHKSGLGGAAANALQLICTHCKKHMVQHINGLIEIARYLEMFELQQDSSIALIKGISNIISRLPNEQVSDVMRTLCSFQIAHLCKLLECPEKSDPTQWLDRLAAIYRHVDPQVAEGQVHPCACVLIEHFPILGNLMAKYQHDSKIMERNVRCIRYAIRCIGKQAMPILEPLVKQMVEIYALQKHSCLLYLGSILVDEFGSDRTCIMGLLKMLEAFIEPTFKILQIENGLKDHPDTVDDFFRLSARFIQRSPLYFLQSPIVTPIIQCAELACTLDHREANASVMKFLCNLLSHGRQTDSMEELPPLIHHIIQLHGENLLMNLLFASVFHLHSYMLPDVADVFVEFKNIDNDKFNDSFKKALGMLPRKNSGGCVTATDVQLAEFYESLLKAQSPRQVTHALQDFCRLFR